MNNRCNTWCEVASASTVDTPGDPFYTRPQEDDLGIPLRSVIGVENLVWGSDGPHAESTFPTSREIVEHILKGVPDREKAMTAGARAARLYHFT